MCQMTPNEDGIPFVTRTATNNGVGGIVEPIEGVNPYPAGSLSIALGGSIGSTFLQTKEFYTSQNVAVLQPKSQLDSGILLFLARLIEKECNQRFVAFGRELNKHIKRDFTINLPLLEEDKPNWTEIDSVVKDQIIPQLPKKAQKVWLKKYDTTPQKQDKMKLNTQDWNSFVLKDLFVMTRGKTLSSDDKEYFEGNIPCVNGTSTNNGVLCYLNEMIEDKGFKKQPVPSLSLCRVGTSGLTFVQTKPYYIADNAFCLKLKEQQSTYVYLFLSTLLDQECVKYCYGRTISSEKYMQTKIKLPVTAEGKPDWQFMEDYIKSLPFSKNIEPSKPNEVVDELMEVKKEMIKMRRAMEAQRNSEVHYHIDTYNDNSKHISLYNEEK